MCSLYFASLALCALAWRALFIAAAPKTLRLLLWVRWLRDSAGNLLAVVPALGEAVAARELVLHEVPLGIAVATTVVDLTMELTSQLLFTLLGVTLVLVERPEEAMGWWLAAGLAVCALGVAGFMLAQHKGLFRLLETLPDRLGSPNNRGGAMVTKGGLVFIGGGDKYLYAFDKKTGKEIWRGRIPYENTAVPMTYRTRSGKQFVVIATGTGADNALVAFALK